MKKFALYAVFFIFALILIGCGKSEKERYIAYVKDCITYTKSDECYKLMKESKIDELNKKDEELAKKNGFKDSKDAEAAGVKLEKDADVKKVVDEIKAEIQKQNDKLMQEMQAQQEAADTTSVEEEVTDSTAAEETSETPAK